PHITVTTGRGGEINLSENHPVNTQAHASGLNFHRPEKSLLARRERENLLLFSSGERERENLLLFSSGESENLLLFSSGERENLLLFSSGERENLLLFPIVSRS
ncbi:hypothetical protein NHX12_022414, partial [Muraenolepis orangiensis]